MLGSVEAFGQRYPHFFKRWHLGGSMLLIMNTTRNAYGAKTEMLQVYVDLDEDFQKYHGYVNNDLFLMINWDIAMKI
jgi:hypothetical protein